jgi:hypothetical protein
MWNLDQKSQEQAEMMRKKLGEEHLIGEVVGPDYIAVDFQCSSATINAKQNRKLICILCEIATRRVLIL